jgi:ribosomal protein S18 acetylase RimI-like enzyme
VRGAGRRLLDESWDRARARGIGLQRVDCYGGDDGKLVRFYESAGFTRTQPFEVDGRPGQLLERRH